MSRDKSSCRLSLCHRGDQFGSVSDLWNMFVRALLLLPSVASILKMSRVPGPLEPTKAIFLPLRDQAGCAASRLSSLSRLNRVLSTLIL
jgi:hypothetical protein